MTIAAALAVAAALGLLGFVSTHWLIKIGRAYEEEYLAKVGNLLDSLHVSVSARLVWQASLLTTVMGILAGFILTRGWILSVFLGCAGALVPFGYLKLLKRRRLRTFQEQVPDLIAQVRTAVACGYTLPMALSMAQRQLPAPTSQELQVVLGHLRLGISLPDALGRLGGRMPGEDLDLFVGATTLAERAGGQLGKILFSIEQSVRERLRLEKKLRTMTAQGRMEAWIIAAAPAALFAGMCALNRPLMDGFLAHPIGIPLLVLAGLWMALGTLIIRRILMPQF